MAGKDYVLLVHGTWAYEKEAPSTEKPWYAPDSDFASRLRARLSEATREPRDWELRPVTWPECDNKHEHRVRGAQRLVEEIGRLQLSDPDGRIHIVAHSHGGNVVLEGLSRWFLIVHRAAFEAFLFALEATLKDRRESETEMSKDWPTQDEMAHRLKETLRHAAESAASRTPPKWKGKIREMTALQHAAVSAISRTDLVEELSALSESSPVTSRWKDLVRNLKDVVRTLDITAFDKVGRDVHRKWVWAAAAADACMAGPSVHGVGRLVFLGTPFFQKRWNVNRTAFSRAVERIGRLANVTLGLLLYVYVLCVVAAVIVARSKAWNPAEWPWWAIGVGVFVGVAVLPQVVKALREQAYYDTNIYFDRGFRPLRRLGAAMGTRRRIPCLVVSAGLMDEVLMGLSAEPVVHGVFRPQLRRWLGLAPDDAAQSGESKRRRGPTAGIDPEVDRGLTGLLVRGALGLVSFLLAPAIKLLWRWLLGPVVERRTLVTVNGVAEMAALGVGAYELRGASVVVSSRPEMDDVFEEHFWNVIEHSLTIAPFRESRREEKRFAFLLPSGDMPGADDRSHFLYSALREQGLQDRRLLETALVVDERVREAVGAFGLIHSTYYGDEDVIRSAAYFLSTGTCSVSSQCTRCGGGAEERSTLTSGAPPTSGPG